MYSQTLMARFLNPAHSGDLERPDGVGEAGNVTCGDVVQISLNTRDGLIYEIRFRAQGCAAAIAGADALCEMAHGTSVTAAQMLDTATLSRALDGVPEERHSCLSVALEALRAAIEQIRSRDLPPAQAGHTR